MDRIFFSSKEKKTKLIEAENLKKITLFFRKNGYIILEEIFPKNKIQELCNSFIKDYSNYFEDREYDDAREVGDKRFMITVEIKNVFNSKNLYAHPFVIQILNNLLEDKFVISDVNCVASLPGAKPMKKHRDGIVFNRFPLQKMLPSHSIGLLIPLIPFNNATGTTRLFPKSHLTVGENYDDIVNYIDPEINIGSCLLMDYRLLHRGNSNLSNKVRPLLYLNYCNPWYFDHLNFNKQAFLVVDKENFDKIPKKYHPLFVRKNINLARNFE